MARQVRQTLPNPPAEYDQQYIAALARSINLYMGQAQALAQVVAARFVMTDPPTDSVGLPVGTLYLTTVNGVPVLTVVQVGDP
jgi:hypothetical protein